MKIQPCSLALTAGILLGIYILGFTWLSILTGGYGESFLKMWEPLHPGYHITVLGSIVGFIYGFVEGFIWFYIGGHLYNIFVGVCQKKV